MAIADTDRLVPQYVVFIDSNVPDLQDLLNGLQPNEVAFVLDPSSDGVQQIANILASNGLTNLSAISIVGHGTSGAVDLGATVLNDADLSSHAAALAQIGAALAPGGDLQLYACNVASGAVGQQFIADLSSFVGGAPVAASTSAIGQTPTGENWTLDALAGPSGATVAPTTQRHGQHLHEMTEHLRGQVANPFTAAAETNFAGTLAAPTTELWIAATAGTNQNLLTHADDTGGGTASNSGNLFTPTSANNPSNTPGATISGLDMLQLDTQDGLYFIASNDGGVERLYKGSLFNAEANPTGTPTYTSLFTETSNNKLNGLAVDPTNSAVYFVDGGHSFDKVSYSGGAVTTLGSSGTTNADPFLEGLALDLPHHVAYFLSATTTTTTTTTSHGVPVSGGSHVHYHNNFVSSIYETSNLTSSSTSVTISKLMDVPVADGDVSSGVGIPGLTVDTVTGTVYFTTTTVNGNEGGVFALNPTTQTITTIWRQSSGGSGILNTGILQAIQVDDATGKYYISILNSNGTGGAIFEGSLSAIGVAPTLFETMPTFNSTISPRPGGFALDNAPTVSIAAVANSTFTESTANPAANNNTPISLITTASDGDTDNTKLVSAKVSVGSFFAGDTLSATGTGNISASYNSTTGVLSLSGLDSFTNYQTVLDSVQFTSKSDNPTDFGSDNSRVLTWTVNDGLLDSAPQSETVTVVGVNDPPTLAGITNASFIENALNPTTLSSGVTVTDPDSLNLASATVSMTGGFAGDRDVLSVNGQTSGTVLGITVSYDAANEILLLSGAATPSVYQTVLSEVTFTTPSDNPTNYGSNPTRTVSWTLFDGSGSFSTATATSTVSVTAVNDPPTLTGTANASFTENASTATPLSPGVTVTDPDSLTLASATVAIVNGKFTGDSDLLSVNGQTSGTILGTSITVSYDAVNEILQLSGADTPADYQTVLSEVTFTTPSDNPTDYGSAPTRTVVWTVNDGSASFSAGTATSTISVTAVNDPPTLTNVATNAQFTEGTPVTLSGAATVVDPDNLNLASATVAVTAGMFPGDVLSVNGQTSGTILIVGDTISVSYNPVNETLVLSGSEPLSDYTTVLDRVTFNSTSDNPDNFGSDTTRTVTWVLNDGTTSGPIQTTTVSVTAVNDPPTLTGTANASFTENASTATPLSPGVTVTDPDSLTLAGATVAIVNGKFAGDGDLLSVNGQTSGTILGTSITVSYDAVNEILQLSGADTPADYQTVLSEVTFTTPSDNPTNFGADPTRTVAWTVNDGSGSFSAGTATSTISVTAVDDPPTLANLVASVTASSGVVTTLSPSVTVTDPDNQMLASATVAITGGTFTGDGDFLNATTTSTHISATYNTASETLVLSGPDTLANYSLVLESVTFQTTASDPTDGGADPTRTVSWIANDGTLSTTQLTTVQVQQGPAIAPASTASFTEKQTTATVLSPSIALSDTNGTTLASATVTILGGAFAGDMLGISNTDPNITVSPTTTGVGLILTGADSLADYQQVLETITFNSTSQNPTDFGSDTTRTIAWTVNDGNASNATNTTTTTINVTAVNDAPTLSNVTPSALFHIGKTVTLSPHVTVTDPDSLMLSGATVQITGGTFAGDGDVLTANTAGTSIVAVYNTASETLTLSGPDTFTDYQNVLDSVTFSSGINPSNGSVNPTRTLSWAVNDGAGSNSLSSAATSTITIGPTIKNDFNGDGTADLLFQDITPPGSRRIDGSAGAPEIYLLNGTTVTSAQLSNPGTIWHIAATGDFNADGNADILWQSTDGTPMLWTMNGLSKTGTSTLTNPGSSWRAVATGNFDAGGNTDIVFQNTDGTPMVYTMNGTSVATTSLLPDPGASWKLIGTGDFNGDGKSDLVFQNTDGTPQIWLMNGTSILGTATPTIPGLNSSWRLVGTGDFNGDGDADLLFQNTVTGAPQIWTMNGLSVASTTTLSSPGTTWKAIGTEDFNGDGKADILFQNTDGTPQIWTTNGTTSPSITNLPTLGANWHASTG